MNNTIASLIRSDIGKLEEYKPIKPLDILSEEIGIPINKLIKLDANENLHGPPIEVQQAIKEADLHIYPDPSQIKLREALATFLSVRPDEIVAGSGYDDLIDILIRLIDPEVIISCPPTFGMYPFLGKINKAIIHEIARKSPPSFDIEQEKVIQALNDYKNNNKKALLILSSPNNPTGNSLSIYQIHELCKTGSLICIDEAYIEFSPHPSSVALLPNYPNLVILRTFSKWAGLAGLRIGYAVAHKDLCKLMMAIKQPYNVNAAADVAARAALKHKDKIFETVESLK